VFTIRYNGRNLAAALRAAGIDVPPEVAEPVAVIDAIVTASKPPSIDITGLSPANAVKRFTAHLAAGQLARAGAAPLAQLDTALAARLRTQLAGGLGDRLVLAAREKLAAARDVLDRAAAAGAREAMTADAVAELSPDAIGLYRQIRPAKAAIAATVTPLVRALDQWQLLPGTGHVDGRLHAVAWYAVPGEDLRSLAVRIHTNGWLPARLNTVTEAAAVAQRILDDYDAEFAASPSGRSLAASTAVGGFSTDVSGPPDDALIVGRG
jgi:hypothetical protein